MSVAAAAEGGPASINQSPRPYQGVPHSDLRKLIRQYDKRIEGCQREQGLIGWSNISDPEWQANQRNIDAALRHMRDIEEEINIRRRRQVEREEAEDRRLAHGSVNLREVAAKSPHL